MKTFCTAPFVGIVIDPGFNIQMCCSDRTRYLKTNLREIDSLRDFFYNSQKYSNLRKGFETHSLLEYVPCLACHRSVEGFASEINNYNTHLKNTTPLKLRYLEVTTSNVCTQTCVMCDPYFSSSHVKLHKEHKIMTMGEDDLKKVYEVLPDLEVLSLKGGEPFADQNNAKLLEELYRVNPNVARVLIVSNGTNISKRFKNVLTKFKKVELVFSIDGVDKVYEWQRGSPYVKTVDSVNTFYKDTGIQYGIISAITVYNLPSVVKDADRYCNDFTGLVSIDSANVVWEPSHVSASLYDVDVLFSIQADIKLGNQKMPSYMRHYKSGLFSINSFSDIEFKKYHKNFVDHTNFYNKVRGFNILDYVPEAKALYNATI